MAFTANDFSPSALGAAVVQEQILVESSRSNELSKEIVAGQAILMNQDPVITTLNEGDKCISAKITVTRNASLDKGNKDFDCEVATGPKAGSESLTLQKEVLTNLERFSIDDTLCNNGIDFGTLLGTLKMRAKAELEGKLSKALVALAGTGLDTPDASWFETTGTVNGVAKTYEVQEQHFTSDLLADLQWAAKSAQMPNAIIINGRNFYNKAILEMYASQGCCTNDAILNRNNFFSIYWDALNVDQVTGAKSSLIIDRNATLFWSSYAYGNMGMENMIEVAKDTYHWTETLPRLMYYAGGQMQPIYVDFRATRYCVKDASGAPRNGWNIEAALFGAMSLNLPNSAGDYGILRVDRVANV